MRITGKYKHWSLNNVNVISTELEGTSVPLRKDGNSRKSEVNESFNAFESLCIHWQGACHQAASPGYMVWQSGWHSLSLHVMSSLLAVLEGQFCPCSPLPEHIGWLTELQWSQSPLIIIYLFLLDSLGFSIVKRCSAWWDETRLGAVHFVWLCFHSNSLNNRSVDRSEAAVPTDVIWPRLIQSLSFRDSIGVRHSVLPASVELPLAFALGLYKS